jgi:hypothetical protein
MRGGFAPNLSNLCPTAARTEEEQTRLNRQAANSVINVPELSNLIISMMSATEIADSVTQTRQERCVAAIRLAGAVDRVNHATGVGAIDREDTWQKLMLGIFPDAPKTLQDLTGQESNIPAPTTYKEMFSQWCQRNKELIAAKAIYKESFNVQQRAQNEFDASYRALKGASESLPFMNAKSNFSDPIADHDYLELIHRIFPNRYAAFKELHKRHRLAKYMLTISRYAIFGLNENVRDARDRMKTWTNDANGLPPKIRRQQAMIGPLDDPRNDGPNTYP